MIKNCNTCAKNDVCAFLVFENEERLYKVDGYEDLMGLDKEINCGSWSGGHIHKSYDNNVIRRPK